MTFMRVLRINIDSMKIIDLDEKIEAEAAASAKLCKSSRSNSSLGASALASCKSQGYRRREGGKSHKIGSIEKKSGVRK